MSASYAVLDETTPLESGNVDPLYRALLGGDIGSALGSAKEDTTRNTLDEPVSETLNRDLKRVNDKAWMILSLDEPECSLREWDLWGPLLNSLLLATFLGWSCYSTIPAFTLSFALIWAGASLVTINARLLGYRIPFLPGVSFLGYCATPLVACLILLSVMPSFWALRVLLVGCGGGWSVAAGMRLMALDPALEDRRLLASMPLCLYFFLIGWFVMIV